MIRVLIAHQRSATTEEIDQMVADLIVIFNAKGIPATITPARDDFKARAPVLGGYPGWQYSVAMDGLFDMIIVPDAAVGQATAAFLRLVLFNGMAVQLLFWDRMAGFRKITGVDQIDPKDRREGWALHVA